MMLLVVVQLLPFWDEVAKVQGPETADAIIHLRLSSIGNSAHQQSFVTSEEEVKCTHLVCSLATEETCVFTRLRQKGQSIQSGS